MLVGVALWRGLSGWWLRGLTACALLAALANPSLQEEDRAPLTDIVLLPTDGSGSFTNLTPDNRYGDDAPRFAPDGRSVLYTRVATANSQGELRRLWQHRSGLAAV